MSSTPSNHEVVSPNDIAEENSLSSDKPPDKSASEINTAGCIEDGSSMSLHAANLRPAVPANTDQASSLGESSHNTEILAAPEDIVSEMIDIPGLMAPDAPGKPKEVVYTNDNKPLTSTSDTATVTVQTPVKKTNDHPFEFGTSKQNSFGRKTTPVTPPTPDLPSGTLETSADNVDNNSETQTPEITRKPQEIPRKPQEIPAGSMADNPPQRSCFTIDTSLIPSIPNQMQATELQGLEGISVFDQEAFEKGVMQQVDHAMTARQKIADKERAEKALNSVVTDIRACKRELSLLDKIIAGTKAPTSLITSAQKDIHRKIVSMRTKRENKAKQLKTLCARRRSLLSRINGSESTLIISDDEQDNEDQNVETYQQLLGRSPTSDGSLSLQPQQESERERLVRLGEMTPFGSRVSGQEPPRPLTDFEKFMMQKNEDDQQKKCRSHKIMKVKEEVVKIEPSVEAKKGTEHLKSAAKRGQRIPSPEAARILKPVASFRKARRPRKAGLGKRKRVADWEEWDESDEEYRPGLDEFQDSSEEDEVITLRKKLKRPSCKGGVGWKAIEDGTISNLDQLQKASYQVSVKRGRRRKAKCIDDATQDMYHRRLKANRLTELRNKQRRIERGESESDSDAEDMTLEGGLTVPARIWNNLYKYQKVGVKWQWELHQQRVGGIVGDEMGLGKTIQMIAFLAALKTSKIRSHGSHYTGLGPVLIVCPATVMHQWVKEFQKWMPDMRVAILHESGAHTGTKTALIRDIALSHSTLVTSYSGVRIQESLLLRHQWHYIILDEGHKIRNPDAAVTVACKQFNTCHRIILSGSPMQNNLRELWSLVDFVFPGKLGTLPVFMEKFSVPITIGGYSNATEVQVKTAYKCACVLRDTINPYLLRRLKADVKQYINLPEKSEQVLFCRLTEDQIQLYKEYLNSKECQMILNREYQVFTGLITLRKICNHPDLVSGGPRIIRGDTSLEANQASEDTTMRYGYYQRSGKMIVLVSLLKLWHRQGNRVLLFSQSKQMLDIIEDYVMHRYSYRRMDGSTTITSRQPLIQEFNTDDTIFVFLLTTRVGGLGVNLTGANRVIIFDPDWNPSTDTQARERAWRIGQKRQVTIYRLITAGAIEEKIYHRQIFKQFLTNRVLKDPRQRRFFKANDLAELFTLTSERDKHGTETSAIFAGVGSDVRVTTPRATNSPRAKNKTLQRTTDGKRIGCQKIDGDQKCGGKQNGGKQDGGKRKGAKEDVGTQNGGEKDGGKRNDGKQDGGKQDVRKQHGGLQQQLQDDLPYQNIPSCSYSKDGIKLEPGVVDYSRQTGTSSGKVSEPKSVKRKRKRRKDARLDGHRIANLTKHSSYEPKLEDAPTDAQKDDYVLRKLFKNSGVHSALQHDSIMDSAHPDYLLVEGEANRVAMDAVRALKESRKHCRLANPRQALRRPRFGQRTNVKVSAMQASAKNRKKKPNPSPCKPTHFSGSELIKVAASSRMASLSSALPSSQTLLTRMRRRNHNTTSDAPSEISPEHQELIHDIQAFVSFQGKTWGQATTEEILCKFRGKLPTDDSALFKAMLNQICTFERVNGGRDGLWRLKGDFR